MNLNDLGTKVGSFDVTFSTNGEIAFASSFSSSNSVTITGNQLPYELIANCNVTGITFNPDEVTVIVHYVNPPVYTPTPIPTFKNQ